MKSCNPRRHTGFFISHFLHILCLLSHFLNQFSITINVPLAIIDFQLQSGVGFAQSIQHLAFSISKHCSYDDPCLIAICFIRHTCRVKKTTLLYTISIESVTLYTYSVYECSVIKCSPNCFSAGYLVFVVLKFKPWPASWPPVLPVLNIFLCQDHMAQARTRMWHGTCFGVLNNDIIPCAVRQYLCYYMFVKLSFYVASRFSLKLYTVHYLCCFSTLLSCLR